MSAIPGLDRQTRAKLSMEMQGDGLRFTRSVDQLGARGGKLSYDPCLRPPSGDLAPYGSSPGCLEFKI